MPASQAVARRVGRAQIAACLLALLRRRAIFCMGYKAERAHAVETDWGTWAEVASSRCADIYLASWHNKVNTLFQHRSSTYDSTFGTRSDFNFACKDLGWTWHPMSFGFDADAYFERLGRGPQQADALTGKKTKANDTDRDLVGEFRRRMEGSAANASALRSGITLCVPLCKCVFEYEERMGLEHGVLSGHCPGLRSIKVMKSRPEFQTHSEQLSWFLCATALASYMVTRLDAVAGLVGLPPPRPAECEATYVDPNEDWQHDEQSFLRQPGIAQLAAPSVAICVQGGVRTFTRPEVHLSIRENVVRSLNAGFLRLFFVLNLTSDACTHTECGSREVRTFNLSDVLPGIASLGWDLVADIHLEPPCCWPQLQSGLQYADCYFDQIAGPAAWRGKESCEQEIRRYEASRGISFDWVMLLRPDVRWNAPIGDIRRFSPGHIYMRYFRWSDLGDKFGLISRELLPIYVSAFRAEGEDGAYRCLTTAEAFRAMNCTKYGPRRNHPCPHWRYDPPFPGAICNGGSFGCTLSAHLARHQVPVRRIPWQIHNHVRMGFPTLREEEGG